MTRNQALAFVDACVSSPKVKSHLGAVLGFGQVPTMPDFNSKDEEAIERCDDLIACLEETAGILRELQKVREKQTEIALGEEDSTASDSSGIEALGAAAKKLRRGASRVAFGE